MVSRARLVCAVNIPIGKIFFWRRPTKMRWSAAQAIAAGMSGLYFVVVRCTVNHLADDPRHDSGSSCIERGAIAVVCLSERPNHTVRTGILRCRYQEATRFAFPSPSHRRPPRITSKGVRSLSSRAGPPSPSKFAIPARTPSPSPRCIPFAYAFALLLDAQRASAASFLLALLRST